MIEPLIILFLGLLSIYSILRGVTLIDEIQRLDREYEEDRIWVSENLTQLLQSMRSLDNMGMFEKDDDVGATFEALIKIIEEYNQKLKYDK